MFFLAFIANDGLKYQYWFRYDNERILEEDLIFFKKLQGRFSTHSSLLFSRSSTDGVKFGPSFKGPRSQVRKTIELRPNALLLSAAAAAGIESIRPAFSFFQSGIAITKQALSNRSSLHCWMSSRKRHRFRNICHID